MRNLTIKRIKSFVGCLVSLKIYIEDSVSGEICINNTPCRKIGDLKNGEEKSFQIDEKAAKVFVIADKLSKNYCNEYYQLPDGQEDIFLSGKNKFNPANGNAFYFNDNESDGIAANRKRNTRKGSIVLITAALVGGVIGYFLTSGLFSTLRTAEKTFQSEGMSITLTEEFREIDIENYTVVYDSKNISVLALKEEFAYADGLEDYTVDQYIDIVLQANNLNSAKIKTTDELIYFEYDSISPETQNSYRYFSYVYKTDDSFWIVQFATLSENADEYDTKIAMWAKSVDFTN